MIQRIQSIWLLLTTVLVFLTYKLPFYVGTNQKGIASYQLLATENALLLIATGILGATAFATIFLFKSRPLQLRLCITGILLECLIVFFYYREMQTFVPGTGTLALWSVFHVAILLFFILAARGIYKDEKLVKDSDRLR